MIITRTPYRVSFVGGGTDLPCFYSETPGMVVTTTIDKYIHLAVSRSFEAHTRLSYSRTEIVTDVDEIEHPLIREAIRLAGLAEDHLHVYSVGDVPAGTGLGSSGAFLVGLLNALWAYKGVTVSPRNLAEQACHIELDVLGEPVGKQDQYAAALGGLRSVQFHTDGRVESDTVRCSQEALQALQDRLLILYLGASRSAGAILEEQAARTQENLALLSQMRDLAVEFRRVLEDTEDLRPLGELLHLNWELKKQLSSGVTNATVDDYYARAREAGATGGKLLGAGATGFLLVFCEPELRARVRAALGELRALDFRFTQAGTHFLHRDPG